jgi:hypothetical protein
MTDTEKAESTIRDLEAKRAAAVKRGVELADERAAVALDAHTGNKAARKRLDEINAALAVHSSELASLDAALKAAGERLEEARAAERAVAEREAAKELRKVIVELRAAGKAADAALAKLVAVGTVMKAAVDAIHHFGVPNPNHAQVLAIGERAIKTTLMQTMWARAFEHIAPSERRAFSPAVDQWCSKLESDIAEKLGEPQNVEAA